MRIGLRIGGRRRGGGRGEVPVDGAVQSEARERRRLEARAHPRTGRADGDVGGVLPRASTPVKLQGEQPPSDVLDAPFDLLQSSRDVPPRRERGASAVHERVLVLGLVVSIDGSVQADANLASHAGFLRGVIERELVQVRISSFPRGGREREGLGDGARGRRVRVVAAVDEAEEGFGEAAAVVVPRTLARHGAKEKAARCLACAFEKCRFTQIPRSGFRFAGWGSHFEESRARVVSPGKKEDTMPAKKAKQSTIIDVIQRGDLSILDAFGQELSQVFAAEVLPKLDIEDTLSLAKVSKACNAAVWNEHGVACMKDKMITKDGSQISPMLWAAHIGNLPAVKALVKAGQDLDEMGFHRTYSYHHGTIFGYPKKTMLTVATGGGHAEVVAFLIQAGADVNIRCGRESRSALREACSLFLNMERASECARLLIEAGADVKTTDKHMATPLMSASMAQTGTALVQSLIDAGANVNHSSITSIERIFGGRHEDAEGDTALHRAAYYSGNVETVKALLRAGAHVDAQSWTGKTALCYAALSPLNSKLVIFVELMKWGASALPLALDYAKYHQTLEYYEKEVSDDDETDSNQ